MAGLVGREAELVVLADFAAALDDGPTALVLEGDPGIGKTALWEAGVAIARERGLTVLTCRPAEAEMHLPFTALGDIFESTDEAVTELPEPQQRALDAAMLRVDWDGPPIEQRAVALAVLAIIRRQAAAAPVVVAIDDVHWLDAPSAVALHFALRRLDTEPVGLLAAQRLRTDERRRSLDEALPAHRRRRIRVAPLDRPALGRVLGPTASRTLTQVHRISGGNPFYALEVARALERREIEPGPGQPFPVPQNLRELVRDRLEQLSGPARETALVVAALPQATVERVEAAAGEEADGLGEALAAGIVEVAGNRVRFTHPLLGSVLYSEASPAERRRLHGRLAELTPDLEERAAHRAAAATGPDPETAAMLDAAAARAARRGAPGVAADLLEQALRLTRTEAASDLLRRAVAAGESHQQAGDMAAARSMFTRAVTLARPGNERARALWLLASAQDFEHELPATLSSFEAAFAEADECGDPALVAAIEMSLAWLCHHQGDRRGVSAHGRRAMELAEQADDKTRLASTLVLLALNEGRGGNHEAFGLLERAFELASIVDVAEAFSRPDWVRGLFLVGEGRLADARTIYLSEYQRVVDEGSDWSLTMVLESLTLVERRAGNWDEATRYAREVYDVASHASNVPVYHAWHVALMHALRGRVEECRSTAAEGVALADAGYGGPIMYQHRAVLGFLELSLGDTRACADVLEPLSSGLTPEIGENGWFRFLADEIEARVALGELERAAWLLRRLDERRPTLLDQAWAEAATARCRGLLLAAERREADAVAQLGSALVQHERLNEPFELARTLLVLGRVQRRFKRRGAARESLTQAREIFASLGAPLWTAQSDDELQRIGGRAPRAAGLTPTEQRVAELAASGLTNREIAAELFLSANTVQAYLKRIYRELGVRSRTELARKLTPSPSSKSTETGVSGSSPRS
jgi:DNA-binding CsgD family transcriptional regulator